MRRRDGAFEAARDEIVEENKAMILTPHDDDDLHRTLAKIGENFAMLACAMHELKTQIERLSPSPAKPPTQIEPGRSRARALH